MELSLLERSRTQNWRSDEDRRFEMNGYYGNFSTGISLAQSPSYLDQHIQIYIHNHSLGTALSDHVRSLSQASQSDFVVGSSPMPLTFQMPRANMSILHKIYTILTPINRPDVPGVSYGANVRWRPKTARTGVLKRVKTMKTEKIWRVLPVMYMPGKVSLRNYDLS